jgi:lipoprotein-anchoring transpeptidase ErfK/SrfK
MLAVVALREQHVTIYDAEGKILQAPVSTGQTGYETPAGVFSVLEKQREHYSNLYDDAEMPFMQRITWTGIALHAGVLPGHAASHGCIRMPYRFAEQLFELTKTGLRVIIVPNDMSPVDFSHPNLFKPGPVRSEVVLASADRSAVDTPPMRLGTPPTDAASARAQTWRAIAAAKAVAADEAAKKWEEARKAATRAAADASRHVKDLRRVEGAVHRAEAQVKDAEHTLAKPNLPPAAMQKAEEMKAKATERLTAAQAQLDAVKAVAQPLIDAATAAREAAKAADAAKASAQSEAKLAAAKLAPVSVFISRKTQRLYVRQAFQPIFDSPIAISDPDTPIGTFVFTALNYANEGADVRWNALAMYADAADREPEKRPASRRGHRDAEPTPSDPAAAKAALDRISIPQEVVERVNEVLSPGSSVIVSDEGPSRETGKGTDFVVVMSDEPQGALKIRKRNPYSSYGYDRGYRYRYRGYYGGPFSWW